MALSTGYRRGQRKLQYFGFSNPMGEKYHCFGVSEDIRNGEQKMKSEKNKKSKKANKPLQKYWSNSVQGSIWLNDNKEGKKFFSINVSANYKDKDGDYQSSSNFFQSQLLDVSFVAGLCATYCNRNREMLKTEDDKNEEEAETETEEEEEDN